VVFLKAPYTVVGPNDTVMIPPGSTKTDWEVELAVVIGRTARYLESPDDALDYVAGYAISSSNVHRSGIWASPARPSTPSAPTW
jgi:2-keto-4-pentenoate hydratase/2-oxohepta-3-ene-1,7-dioic acid hydratase in catechol pathway